MFNTHGSLPATHTAIAELWCLGAAMGTGAKHVHVWVTRYDPWHRLSTLCPVSFQKQGLGKTVATNDSLIVDPEKKNK